MGIRLDEEEELKGCDLVDHNIEAMLIHSIGKTSSFGPAKVNPYGEDEKFEKGPQGNYPMGNMNTGMAWVSGSFSIWGFLKILISSYTLMGPPKNI